MRLLRRQRQHLPAAQAELLRDGCKTGHYMWWLTPCDQIGVAEPQPATYLTLGTARQLLARADDDGWLGSLDALVTCGLRHGAGLRGVLPGIDWPRLHHFIDFWERVVPPPSRFARILQALGALTRAPVGQATARPPRKPPFAASALDAEQTRGPDLAWL